jgi:arylformamidase
MPLIYDVSDLEKLDWTGVERVLFRTQNSDHWLTGKPFDSGYVHLTGAGARFLVSRKLRLVGTDGLGIEDFGHKEHPAPHALLGAGVTLLEGLYLAGVPPGDYTLFCGPLRIEGGDGAPARAFLVAR